MLPPAPVVPVAVAVPRDDEARRWAEFDRVHGSAHLNNAETMMQRRPLAPVVPVAVAGRPAGRVLVPLVLLAVLRP